MPRSDPNDDFELSSTDTESSDDESVDEDFAENMKELQARWDEANDHALKTSNCEWTFPFIFWSQNMAKHRMCSFFFMQLSAQAFSNLLSLR